MARRRREADLVVDDEVDRAAGAVTLEARQAEALGHHALAGKRGVAVDQQRHDGRALARLAAVLVLLGAHLAEHHRIDDLEMRGVGGQRQVHVVAVERAVRGSAEVILHVARAFDVVGLVGAALELVEDGAVRLGHHVGQHVEAAAVGHAHHDLLHAELAAALDDLLERRNHQLAAVETEALGAGVLDVGEPLEGLRLDQLVEDGALAFDREVDVLVATLDALLDPGLLHRRGDVHELHADLPAVGAAQDLEDVAHGGDLETQHLVDEDRAVEVGVREAVGLRPQLLVDLALGEAERIEVGGEVAHHAIGADQHEGADAVLRGAQRGHRRQLEAGRRRLGIEPVLDLALGGAVVACERAKQVLVVVYLLHRPRPGRTVVAVAFGRAVLLLQRGEEMPPLVADRSGVALILSLHLLDVGGIGALQEGSARKRVVLGLSAHVGSKSRGV